MSYINEINYSYSIKPTQGETQYEAYQSIFAYIMNTDKDSPYIEIGKIDDIEIVQDCLAQRQPHKTQTKILYIKKNDGSAHYKGFVKGEIMDPYDYYQLKTSEGFCQMFAYFITSNNTKDFIEINQAPLFNTAYEMNITKQKIIADLAKNTQNCCKKSIDLLNTLKYNKSKEFFETEFEKLKEAGRHGIPFQLTLDEYLQEFKKINSESKNIEAYIIENYEKIYNDETKRKGKNRVSLEDMGIIFKKKVIRKKSRSMNKVTTVKRVRSQSRYSSLSNIKKTIRKTNGNQIKVINVNSRASKKKRKRKRKI